MRALILAVTYLSACSDSTTAPADLAGCESTAVACRLEPCPTYAEMIAPACAAHEAIEGGQCGGYDILVFHTGLTAVTNFYDHATGQFLASRDRHGQCTAPPGFVFPTCGPETSTYLCLDGGVTD